MTARIFAISDLHLSNAVPKPMGVFGEQWEDHDRKIQQAWHEEVTAQDIVLVAGDISWALKLPQALPDLRWIEALPGEKVLVKGNHDYWWQGIAKLRAAAAEGMHFVQNDAVVLGDVAIGGTRLWNFPEVRWASGDIAGFEARVLSAATSGRGSGSQGAPEKSLPSPDDDEKICKRELKRLRMSLSKLPDNVGLRIAVVHFPPLGLDGEATELTEIMDEFGIDLCVYGHIHPRSPGPVRGADQRVGRTRYVLTSADVLGFRPRRLWAPEDHRCAETVDPCRA